MSAVPPGYGNLWRKRRPDVYFDSLSELMAMQGHGPYVWSAYAIFVVVLGWLVAAPLREKRRVMAEILRQQRRQDTGTTEEN